MFPPLPLHFTSALVMVGFCSPFDSPSGCRGGSSFSSVFFSLAFAIGQKFAFFFTEAFSKTAEDAVFSFEDLLVCVPLPEFFSGRLIESHTHHSTPLANGTPCVLFDSRTMLNDGTEFYFDNLGGFFHFFYCGQHSPQQP